jgi:hypothetical protein
MAVFYDVVPCILALMMAAVSTSEMSANLCETARRNIPGDDHVHTRRGENLKSN